jgi:hypothetical protein
VKEFVGWLRLFELFHLPDEPAGVLALVKKRNFKTGPAGRG